MKSCNLKCNRNRINKR